MKTNELTLLPERLKQLTDPRLRTGVTWVEGEGAHVRLWAPYSDEASIEWQGRKPAALKRAEDGYFTGLFPDMSPGSRYYFHVNGKKIPDPASRFQPEDIFGPSEVVATEYQWTDQDWRGIPFDEWVIYEIHTGTFSEQHGFQGIIDDLPRLKELGITTIEIMPVAQFPGERNWGYDGVFPHAVQHSYGGPQALKALVDACHRHGLAIILDVVYNHLGPEGNVLPHCGPYLQEKYKLQWGSPLNYDDENNDPVRRYFLQSAWQWLTEFHFDGLRLDAVQMIFDNSAIPFLEELSALKAKAEEFVNRPLVLIAETDANDPRILKPSGFNLEAQWADDFHHALHATLTGEKNGYYADYGGIAQLGRIYERGVAFEGNYSPYRKRRHGRPYEGIAKNRLIVAAQNHDQVGNRLEGDRLNTNIGYSKMRLAAAAVFLSPFTPLMFMGAEWGCRKPFMYFISYHDKELARKTAEHRKKEWQNFGWQDDPPDPADPQTFRQCVLEEKIQACRENAGLFDYYRQLITLSKRLRRHDSFHVRTSEVTKRITLVYFTGEAEIAVFLSFSDQETTVKPDGEGWHCLLDSAAGADDVLKPFSAKVFEREIP